MRPRKGEQVHFELRVFALQLPTSCVVQALYSLLHSLLDDTRNTPIVGHIVAEHSSGMRLKMGESGVSEMPYHIKCLMAKTDEIQPHKPW